MDSLESGSINKPQTVTSTPARILDSGLGTNNDHSRPSTWPANPVVSCQPTYDDIDTESNLELENLFNEQAKVTFATDDPEPIA